MIRIKRITALIMAAIMSFSLFAAAQEQQEELLAENEDYILLKGIGMIDASFDSLNADGTMTRTQFAAVCARLMGCMEYTAPTGNRFVDIESGNEYEDEIYFLRSRGVITGIDEYRFKPNSPITLGEACTIAVTALGGKDIAQQQYGGYTDGYMKMAQKAGIVSSAADSDRILTLGEGIKLLKNTAFALVWIENLNSANQSYSTEKDRTLIAEYCGIYSGEGIVTDNGITALGGATAVGENHVIVGGIELSYSGDSSELIGIYTEYWYNEDEEELIYIREKKGRNEILTVPADLLCVQDSDFGVSEITYYTDYEGGKRKTARIRVDADLIYNGEAYPEFDSQALKIQSGSLTLINNSGSKGYNVVIVKEYENCIVKLTDVNGNRIYGSNGLCLKLNDYSHVKVYNDKGELREDLSDVVENNVVSYMISKSKNCITIYASAKSVTVKVIEVGSDVTDYYAAEDGERYRPSRSFLNDLESDIAGIETPKSGSTYLMRLDVDGKVAAATEQLINVWRYAYYIGMRPQEDEELGPWFKLIMQDGSVFYGYPANKVSVNGSWCKAADLLYHAEIGSKRQIIRVRLNGDGDINGIETAKSTYNEYGYDSEIFSKDATIADAKYYGNNTCIMGKYAINSDTMIICDPDKDKADAGFDVEDVEVIKTSAMGDGIRYSNIDIYDADLTLCAAAVVYEKKGGDTYNTQLFTVDKVTTCLDEYDEIQKKVIGVSYGSRVEYTEYKDGVFPEGLKRGDVARIVLDGTKIRSMEVMLSLADRPKPQVQVKIGGSINDAEWVNMFGYVYGKSKNAVSVYFGTDSPYGPIQTVSLNNNAVKVTVYDAAENTVTPGSISDIIPGGTVNKNGSFFSTDNTMIFVYRRYENMREAVVVKYPN